MGRTVVFLALLCVSSQVIRADYLEKFDEGWNKRWIQSLDSKYMGHFTVEEPSAFASPALRITEKALHYGISTKLDPPFDPKDGIVLQYTMKFDDGLDCGGAYIKFVTDDSEFTPKFLKDSTPYSIMFGPDRCGSTNKVHLILRHQNPKMMRWEEKHLVTPPNVPADTLTHVYTAILRPDNTYALLIDGVEKKAGNLYDDFLPSVIPPEEVIDADDVKPKDWVDLAKIPDETAVKPADWDDDAPKEIPDPEAVKPEGWLDNEPEEIPDPEAEKPDDWDENEDGQWEAPLIPNPKCEEEDVPGCGEWEAPLVKNPAYKGKWTAPMIDNPEYKGPWKPRMIPNPFYYNDRTPLANIGKIGGIAVEVWTMDKDYFYDNILITADEKVAEKAREDLWRHVYDREVEEEEEKKAQTEGRDIKPIEADVAAPAAAATAATGSNAIADLFVNIIEGSPLKATLKPLTDAVKGTPALAYVVAALPVVLLFGLLSLGGKKAPVDATARAKKEDITSADDVNGIADKAKAAASEITEEEDEGVVKRRTRRDT